MSIKQNPSTKSIKRRNTCISLTTVKSQPKSALKLSLEKSEHLFPPINIKMPVIKKIKMTISDILSHLKDVRNALKLGIRSSFAFLNPSA